MYETADFMYLLPPYRFSVYAIGIVLGYILRNSKNLRLTRRQLYLGWLVAVICFAASINICIMNQNHSSLRDAVFASIATITLNMFYAWTIFAAHLGYRKSNNFIISGTNSLIFSMFQTLS